MAKFEIVLDKRTELKSGKYPLKLRITDNTLVRFISLNAKYTIKEYSQIFIKTPDKELIVHRERANEILSRAVRIGNSIIPFNYERFKELFIRKEIENRPKSIFIEDIFNEYIERNHQRLSLKSIHLYKSAKNKLLQFKPQLLCSEVNKEFLYDFEAYMIKQSGGALTSTLGVYLRNLRCIINYAIQSGHLGKDYEYPFRKHIYTIPTVSKIKRVLTIKEIESVVNFTDFQTKEQEMARDLWLMCYYCNGINFKDLLLLKWEDRVGDFFIIKREKTKRTTRSNPKLIRIPIISKLQVLLSKISAINSPYVLGLIKENYTESQIYDKKSYLSKPINRNLQWLSDKLNLTVPLRLKTARDSFATTLKRKGVSREVISEKMAHSDILVTAHYLDSFEDEEMFNVNEHLL